MGRFNGIKYSGALKTNSRDFKRLKVRRSIDLMELEDRGTIAEGKSDLPTRGAGHRRHRDGGRRGARGATVNTVDLGYVSGLGSNVVDNQDFGLISDTALTYNQTINQQRFGSLDEVTTDSVNTPVWNPNANTTTFVVTVGPKTGGGNAFYLDSGSGPVEAPAITLDYGQNYIFDVSDSSNNGHPFAFTIDDGVSEYKRGIARIGSPGQARAKVRITIPNGNAISGMTNFKYYCTVHGTGMGNTINLAEYIPPTYSLSADNTTVNEGGTVTFTLTTTNVADGTNVAYTVTGIDANDLSSGSLTGNITVNSNTGTAVFTLAEDVTTEGDETMTLTLDNGGDALDVVITDSSTTPGVTSADFSNTTLVYTLDNPNAYDTSASDLFGFSVSISNTHAIVGAYAEDDLGGSGSGKAYIYDTSDGSLLYTLDNPNAHGTSAGDNFGVSVDISDTHAIVGAYAEDDLGGSDSGKAYIYDLSDGSLAYTLDNPNAHGTSAGDIFGFSVSISSNHAIVGAYQEDDAGGNSSGKAYIYDLSDGSLAYTLDNPNAYDTSTGDDFGESVSISNTHAIVGAHFEDDAGGGTSGKAYIFDVTTGNLVYTLDNPNAYGTSASDRFGNSVSISDSHAIVGAHFEDDAGGSSSGKAYIFDLSDGSLLYTLDNPNAHGTSANDRFGESVSISDTHAIVGAYAEDEADYNTSGKAYIFDLSDGSLVYTLDNPTPYSTGYDDRFGFSVSISNTHAIAGAYLEDDAGGTSSGKAYVYQGVASGSESSGSGSTPTPTVVSGSSETSIHITTDGAAGVNNSFADSSSNAYTITANGDPQLNTFSPYRHGGYSTNFDGSDYITSPITAIGTGDFTAECWVYPTAFGQYGGVFSSSAIGAPTGISVSVDQWWLGSDTAYTTFVSGNKFTLNTWQHVAVVRNGTTVTGYVDGLAVGTAELATDLTSTSMAVGSRYQNNGSYLMTGTVSDFRLVNSAVYTETFTPPTERLTAITGTELLTCHLPYIADGSSNGHSITINGDPQTKPTSPYDRVGYSEDLHGGSVHFIDNTDRLSATVTAPGTGDFTMEAWVYFDTLTGNQSIMALGNYVPALYYRSATTEMAVYYSSGQPILQTGFTPKIGQWYHMAMVRESGTVKVYIDGKQEGSSATLSSNLTSTTLNIGYDGVDYFGGNLGDVRYSTSAVYTSAFTPPAAPLESTNAELHIKGVEGHIIDKSQSGNNFTLVGNTTASTSETKYAGSSISLDGTGDHIQLENTPEIDVSTGDFTWEGWFNWNDLSNNPKIFISGGSATAYWQLYVYSSKLTLRVNSSQIVYGVDTTNISTNQWYHIALVRSGDTFTVYKDGVSVITDTYAGSIGHYSDNGIGGQNSYPASSMNGYMEDVRLSKFARYTESFTPPTESLATYSTTGGSATPSSSTWYGDRGVWMGGEGTSHTNTIDYIDITSAGNATDFGDLSENKRKVASFSNGTRGVSAGGQLSTNENTNVIEYITFSSIASATDFGDLSTATHHGSGSSDGTTGLISGGKLGSSGSYAKINVIQSVTIDTASDASDFGDLTFANSGQGGCNDATYSITMGGEAFDSDSDPYDTIEYVSFATSGNSSVFGNLIDGRMYGQGVSDTTRGIIAGGLWNDGSNSGHTSSIEYITMATLSNASAFGNLVDTSTHMASTGCSNATTGVFGGFRRSTDTNIMESIVIQTTGNASDFGDLTVARRFAAGAAGNAA